MPGIRRDRTPERTEGIAVELTEFGLWIEIRRDGGGLEGIFLSARALRRLVALPFEERIAALAALDPAMHAVQLKTPAPEDRSPRSDGQPGRRLASKEAGSGARIAFGSDHAPSLHHHKE
jgi:hypothetical protein